MLNAQSGHSEGGRGPRDLGARRCCRKTPSSGARISIRRSRRKLRQFFLTYGQGNTPEAVRQRGYMAKVNVGGFKPADDSHLLPVREMEATDLWLQAKKTGDASKTAAGPRQPRRHHGPARRARRPHPRPGRGAVADGGPSRRRSVPLRDRALDLLIWGGLAVLLVVGFRSAEIHKIGGLFAEVRTTCASSARSSCGPTSSSGGSTSPRCG